MSQASVQSVHFNNEPAIQLNAGGYQAVLVPGLGANMVELSRPGDFLSFLRTPDNIDQLRKSGQRYGIPPLFPPNRIVGGRFSTPHREYTLPLNTPDGQHFIHGILHKKPWQIKASGVREDGSAEITLLMNMDKNGEMYPYFPHEFTYELTYALSEEGLQQHVLITNHSNEPMPLGVGFHTAFKVPFHAEGQEQDYRLQVSVKEQWDLLPSFIPSGKPPLESEEQQQLVKGIQPTGEPYAKHFTCGTMHFNGENLHGAALTDTARGISFVYEVDDKFTHWVIWNDDGKSGFICPEPQTMAINAPNVPLPAEITGFQLLAPGTEWSAVCRMYVKKQ